ncbi:MAG: hypothetical protein ACXWTP_10560 [Methylosarcina sp.]
MSSGKNSHRENFNDLPDEIRETELKLIDRQHRVHMHADTLVRDLRQELSSPTNLILASQLGFIIGELTKSPPKKDGQTEGKKAADGVSKAAFTSLEKVLGLPNLASTWPQMLPLALVWLMDTFHPELASKTGSAKTGSAAQFKTKKSPPRQSV